MGSGDNKIGVIDKKFPQYTVTAFLSKLIITIYSDDHQNNLIKETSEIGYLSR